MDPRVTKPFIALFLLLWLGPIKSQDDWRFSFTNEVDVTTRYYANSSNTFLDKYQGEIRSFHNLKVRYKSIFGIHLLGRSTLNVNSSSRNRAWYNEAYATLRHNKFSLKLGKQIIKWGSITGISAMDMANRYDYYDYLSTDRENLGTWAGKSKYNIGPVNINFQIAEVKNRSSLHFNCNRWIRMPITIRIPQDPENVYSLELERINNDVEKNSPQLSLEVDFDIESVSSRLFAYEGSNDIPQRSIDINLIEGQNVTYDLSLLYHDLKIYGVGQSSYLGDWNVWYELSSIQNQRIIQLAQLEKDSYWNFTIGVDRIFNFDDPEKSLKWIFQYCNIIGANDSSYNPTDLDHIFSNSILTELQYAHNYKWEADLRSVIDLDHKGFYLNPRIKHVVSDQLHFVVSADVLLGSHDSFWGHYSDNTRLSFQARYTIL